MSSPSQIPSLKINLLTLGVAIVGTALGCISLAAFSARAEVVPDQSLGENQNSRVTPNVQIGGRRANRIDGGARPQQGANLFHSFREFNIGRGERVYFHIPDGVENVFSRVTGNRSSNIQGILGMDGAANLFLLNPNGIIFGSSAQINVNGAFVATTADAIQFGNQGFFSATDVNPSIPTLTIQPSAFLFNQIAAQPIVSQVRRLAVPSGESLVLLGGNVNLENSRGVLAAAAGRIELGSVAGSGRIPLTINGNDLRLTFPENVARAAVMIDGQSENFYIDTGNIAINAGSITLDQTSLTGPNREGITGEVTINAQETISLERSYISTTPSGDAGETGNITIQANEEVSLQRSTIDTSTSRTRPAGNIEIKAGSIALTELSGLLTQTFGAGRAGEIVVRSDRLTIDRSTLSTVTYSAGNAGRVDIETGQLRMQDGEISVSASGVGQQAGNIRVTANSVHLSDTSVISADTGAGNGGNIELNNLDTLLLQRESRISTNAGTEQSGGNGGNIRIGAQFIVASPFENSDITANAFAGSGGRVAIEAEGIIGLVPRSRADLQERLETDDPNQLKPENLPSSDITAISQTNPDLEGEVIIRRPDADPSQGLVELPGNPVDAANLIAQACSTGSGIAETEISEFVVTGRGGLPPSPRDMRQGEVALSDWAVLGDGDARIGRWEDRGTRRHGDAERISNPFPMTRSPSLTPNSQSLIPNPQLPITEAHGWIRRGDGRIALVAQVPVAPAYSTTFASSCH